MSVKENRDILIERVRKEIIGPGSDIFQSNEDFVNAFAALNYAHGWLDSGVRLDVFKVEDDSLFTVK